MSLSTTSNGVGIPTPSGDGPGHRATATLTAEAPAQAHSPDLATVLQDLATTLRKSVLPTPELVSAKAAARIAGVSTPSWYRLVSAGKAPAPVRLAGSVRWRRAELSAWITAGCPARKNWEAIRDTRG